MVYDAARGSVLLFGGDRATAPRLLGDTWTWDGRSWTERHAGRSPSPRTRMAIAYDEVHQVVVLFGGTDRFLTVPGSANQGDTWIWDGNAWTLWQPAAAPNLAEAVMTFDETSRNVVLFGSRAQGGAPETWTWDGGSWKQAHPAFSPPGRLGASMAYDPVAHRVVVFGGFNQNQGNLNDTWVWDGATWNQAHPQNAPPARQNAVLADSSNGLVLFGGQGVQGPTFGDTWKWNGADWLLQQPATVPCPRVGASVANDTTRSLLVMFGGVVSPPGAPAAFADDVWTWNGADWKAAAS